jgi:hypothetical protein
MPLPDWLVDVIAAACIAIAAGRVIYSRTK